MNGPARPLHHEESGEQIETGRVTQVGLTYCTLVISQMREPRLVLEHVLPLTARAARLAVQNKFPLYQMEPRDDVHVPLLESSQNLCDLDVL